MRIQLIHFPVISRAHGTTRAFHDIAGFQPALAFEAAKFIESRLENAGHTSDVPATRSNAFIKLIEVAAGPEHVLEIGCVLVGAFDGEYLDEDIPPGKIGRAHV